MAVEPTSGDRIDMDQLLDEAEREHQHLQRGQIVEGIVMKLDQEGILVNVGQKTEGMVSEREMRSLSPQALQKLKVGDSITVAVLRPETDEGQAILSIDKAMGETGGKTLEEQAAKGAIVDAPVTGYNKGGAVVMVDGVQGFIPLSQLRSVGRTPVDAEINPQLASLVGKTLKVKVIEVNRKRNRAIFSERAAAQEVRQAQKDQLLDQLQEGEFRRGRISGLTAFGAFVDLGGADGLIHISELSWQPVRAAEDVVKVGDEVQVCVVKVDKVAKRIALSLKRTQPEPWTKIVQQLQVGQVTGATITKLATFGAFARLDENIEGLIHISELADRVIQHPKEVVREGEQVVVKIVKIEPDRRRIGLSIKQVAEREADEIMRQFHSKEGEQQHRVERPALDATMAAQLAQAVSANAAADSQRA